MLNMLQFKSLGSAKKSFLKEINTFIYQGHIQWTINTYKMLQKIYRPSYFKLSIHQRKCIMVSTKMLSSTTASNIDNNN